MKHKFYQKIPGWISDKEADELYRISINVSGSILEIGTMYGKSTSVVCEAILDSSLHPVFDSCDINFKDRHAFVEFYTKIHGGAAIPDILENLSFSQNKDVFDVTRMYLNQFDLLKFVNLIPGNFHNLTKKYDFIFCDAMHDINELNLNLPHLIRLSNPQCIWAIHDFNCISNHFIPMLNYKNNIKYINLVDSLGIFMLSYE